MNHVSREQVADRIHSAAIHLLRAVRKDDQASGLSPARLSALSVVVFAGPLTLGALAAAEQVTAATISRLVAGLEADGFVRRRPHPSDRRAVRLEATPKGLRTLERARRRRLRHLEERLRTLAEDEVETVGRAAEMLERLFGR